MQISSILFFLYGITNLGLDLALEAPTFCIARP